jgi:hypothetical protein
MLTPTAESVVVSLHTFDPNLGSGAGIFDAVAPICLGTIERPIGCHEQASEVPILIDRHCHPEPALFEQEPN